MASAQDEFDALFADKERRARHPEDERDSAEEDADERAEKQTRDTELDSSDDDEDTRAGAKMPSKWFLPKIKSEANTGPKGVIADAHAFEQAKRADRNSLTSAASKRYTLSDKDIYANGEKDEEDDHDEESFMARWRRSRLNELKNVTKIANRTTSPSRKIYGSLMPVDANGYLDAIEKVPADTVVVVFIFDDRSEISSLVEECIRQVARKHNTTRFVKLHYEEAEMEIAGVPAVLAYRGGDKFAGLVPVMDEIPDDAELSAQSLGAVMKRHQIL